MKVAAAMETFPEQNCDLKLVISNLFRSKAISSGARRSQGVMTVLRPS